MSRASSRLRSSLGPRAIALAALVATVAASGCGGGSKARPVAGGSGATSTRVWSPGKADTLGTVVAIVGTRRIRAHEVDSLIATAPPNVQSQLRDPQGYKTLVDRMVTEEALYQAARRSGIQKDPAYRAAVAKAARETLMRQYYQSRMANFPPPTDAQIQAYYEEHSSEFAIPARARVRHIQVATKAKAEALRKRLAAGGLWDALAKANSTDKATSDHGGLVGYVTPSSDFVPGIGKAPDIVKEAFALKEGETSPPLKSEKGWHLIRVDNVDPARTQPLAEVRQGILGHLSTQAQETLSQTFLDSLKNAAGAVVFEDSVKVASTPARSAQDFFKEAQAASSPQQRIQLYRDVVTRYPDDPVSVQAAFMIGFTYAEDLGQYDEAKAEFRKFLDKYPRHELANSAKWMLENMDKPAPELDDAPEGADSTGAPPDTTR
ncbi:MAG TPA: peptidyl-prolyl cis-trans isomerase [Candidatus Eisenbacteria bacterium]|nr:peptidyl-prolyl cis-trans isomerase [Candidatus Eisenbacteria bacterium]